MYTWQDVQDKMDPVYGVSSDDVAGVMAFFILTTLVYITITLWSGMIGIFSVTVVARSPFWLTRFIFMAFLSSIVMSAQLFDIFLRSLTLRNTALSFVFFNLLYNLYIWLLSLGYLPAPETVRQTNATDQSDVSARAEVAALVSAGTEEQNL